MRSERHYPSNSLRVSGVHLKFGAMMHKADSYYSGHAQPIIGHTFEFNQV